VSALASLGVISWHVLDRVHLGSKFAISPHGVGIAVGYLAGSFVLLHEGPKRGVSEERISSLVFWGLIGSIVGARVGYVLSHLSQFHNIVDVLQVYKGGISLIGGIIGWIVFSVPVLRKHKVSILNTFDAAAMPLALGIVIGRVGDLIIGDHLGEPTSWALAFQYHGGKLSGYDCGLLGQCIQTGLSGGRQEVISATSARLLGHQGNVIAQGVGVHQTALYDFGSTMLLVLLLMWLLRKPKPVGILTFTFGLWYAGVRIVTDFLRTENRFLGLTGSQWTSVVAVAFCIAAMVWVARRSRRADEPVATPPATTG